jgi:hypothetical protein
MVVTYDEFLPILDDKLKNPPVPPSRKELKQKKRAASALLVDVSNKKAARLQNEQLFVATVAQESEAAKLQNEQLIVATVAQESEAAKLQNEQLIVATVAQETSAQQSQAPAPRKKRTAAPSDVPKSQTKRPAPDVNVSATAAATTPAASRSQGVNYTQNHLLYFKRCKWQIIEGGGGGNCFFHSVTAINKIHRNRKPELFHSHYALRKQICAFWRSNLATLKLNGMMMADVPGIDATIAKTAKQNVDAEYEVVAAFASMIQEAVIVWNMHSQLPWVMFPDGRCLGADELLPDTPWRFWADGGHYQAVVGKGNVVMRAGKSVGDVVNIRDIVCNE